MLLDWETHEVIATAFGQGRTHDFSLFKESATYVHPDTIVLADLGYEGERDRLVLPVKRTTGVPLTEDQASVNALHSAVRARAEQGNAWLKNTFKALRRVTLCPWRITAITAAALVLLHHDHHRTT